MTEKLQFYEVHGVKEYDIYDPDGISLEAGMRTNDRLQNVAEPDGWVSPPLGIRFDLSCDELRIIRPDGERFLTYFEQEQRGQREQTRADAERLRAEKIALRLRERGS
jgi:hypothetical protein